MAVHRWPDLLWGHMVSSESHRQEPRHPSPYVQRLSLSTSPAQEVSFVTSFGPRSRVSRQSQSLSTPVHLFEPLCICWTLGSWPSTCKLFSIPLSLWHAAVASPFPSTLLLKSVGMKSISGHSDSLDGCPISQGHLGTFGCQDYVKSPWSSLSRSHF